LFHFCYLITRKYPKCCSSDSFSFLTFFSCYNLLHFLSIKG
jgi:hypothetical protein